MNAEKEKHERKSIWASVLPTATVAFLTTVATIGAASLTFFKESRELDIEMVKLSLAILKGEFEAEDSSEPIHARRFALKALVRFSGVEMTNDELEQWAQRGGVPIDEDLFSRALQESLSDLVKLQTQTSQLLFERGQMNNRLLRALRDDPDALKRLEEEGLVNPSLREIR
ncbi:hypothetical protein [uncultured Roseobacter sp.]|uniref:hypothetical protein n=1 Tax=uncultured Roseobacter sp. TaxID=114847 RepID=UPI0026271C19|nr:hypothetical protein [uncultured Roseobacter sp.]